MAKFIADGASGKVYRATNEDNDNKAAVKIIQRGEGNENELENEIRALRVLSKCKGVQRFLVAFEHCGPEPLQLISEDHDSEQDSEKDNAKNSGNDIEDSEKDSERGSENESESVTADTRVERSSNCSIWVATEWVEGKPLLELIESGQTFTPRQAKEFGKVLVETLSRVHEKGIVHSDFDSSNIIVGPGNVPVVVDFGEAEWVESGGETGNDVLGLVLTLVEMITGVTERVRRRRKD